VLQSDEGDWELASRARLSSEPLAVYAVARVSAATDSRHGTSWAGNMSAERRIDGERLYRQAHLAGLDYGPRFKTVTCVEITGPDSAIAYLDPSPVGQELDSYLLHPALLDGALQGLFGLLADRRHQVQGVGFLPWRFGRVRLPAPPGRVPRQASNSPGDVRSTNGHFEPISSLPRFVISTRQARWPISQRSCSSLPPPASRAECGRNRRCCSTPWSARWRSDR